jgi:sugar/nucleoside kinase (ribokinase family)
VQSHELIKKAIRMAKEAGAKVIIDLASYNVVEANRDFLRDTIRRYIDVVFANEEEAKALLNMDAENAVSALAKETGIAIVKTGEKGSWIQQGNEKIFVPALKVNCIDTTGAGDLYASGFIYGLINGYPPVVCGKAGTLLAGNVVENIGAKIDENKWAEIIRKIRSIETL